MIVSYREADLTIRTVMKAEDSDEILDIFEGIVYSMFQDFGFDEIFERIESSKEISSQRLITY